jgi:DNA-binding GntR family transcriptional regulator
MSRSQRTRVRAARVDDETIYREIYDAIIDHRIPPGTALPEEALATAFGVSRTTVRKAMLRLGHERLIELRRNRGAVVAQPSVEEARQVFEARRVVEAALLPSAIERATKPQLEKLRALLKAELAAEAEGNRSAHVRLSGDFHRHLAEIAGNNVLVEFLGELISRSSLVLALYEGPGAILCSHGEHAAIFDAIVRRDVKEALGKMRGHLERCEQRLDLTSASEPIELLEMFAHVRANASRRDLR